MDPQIALSAQLYDVSTVLMPRSVEGLNREELCKPAGPESTPMIWMAAHLTQVRHGLLKMLGEATEIPWDARFGRGSTVRSPNEYPRMEEILDLWSQTAAALRQRLGSLTDAELSAKPPREFRIADKSLRGAIAYLAYHEAYHVGQMAYLRKWLGKESLVG